MLRWTLKGILLAAAVHALAHAAPTAPTSLEEDLNFLKWRTKTLRLLRWAKSREFKIRAVKDALLNYQNTEDREGLIDKVKQQAVGEMQAWIKDPELKGIVLRDTSLIRTFQSHLLSTKTFSTRQLSLVYGDIIAADPNHTTHLGLIETLLKDPERADTAITVLSSAWVEDPKSLNKYFDSKSVRESLKNILRASAHDLTRHKLNSFLTVLQSGSVQESGIANPPPLDEDELRNLFESSRQEIEAANRIQKQLRAEAAKPTTIERCLRILAKVNPLKIAR